MTVDEQTEQLGLRFETAEERPRSGRSDGGGDTSLIVPPPSAVPKSKRKEEKALSATMEEVCKRLLVAFQNVASNKGAAGPDRQSIEDVRVHLSTLLPALSTALLEGTYTPGNVRRVWLPKAGGGERGLGIPNVIDRVVQEAVRQVLDPDYSRSCSPDAQARGLPHASGAWLSTPSLARRVEPSTEILRNLASLSRRAHCERE